MKYLLLIIVLLCTSCTFVRYKSVDKSLMVIDMHPGGEALSLSGMLNDTGSLEVNRETDSSDVAIGAVTEGIIGAIVPN